MTREEWYDSKKFHLLRLLNNLSFEIGTNAQYLYDLLRVIAAEYDISLQCIDAFSLYERQLRVVKLESEELRRMASKLYSLLNPEEFDLGENNGQSSGGEQKKEGEAS